MAKPANKHETWHAEATSDGNVLVGCKGCKWRDVVNVAGLSWVEGMQAIFAARDAHVANPAATTRARAAAPASRGDGG